MNKSKIIRWLKSTDLPISVISRKSSISRNTLYSWKEGKAEIRDKNAEKLYSLYHNQIDNTEGESRSMEYKYMAELQKDVISQKDKEIASLQQQLDDSRIDSNVEDLVVNYDFVTKYHMKLSPKGVLMAFTKSTASNTDMFTDKQKSWYLKCLDIGMFHPWTKHPIVKHLDTDSLKETNNLVSLLCYGDKDVKIKSFINSLLNPQINVVVVLHDNDNNKIVMNANTTFALGVAQETKISIILNEALTN